MSNTTISRTWITRTVLTVLLTGATAWITWASTTTWKHETRITVAETNINTVNKSLDEIKLGQKDMNQKIEVGQKELNQKLDQILLRRR